MRSNFITQTNILSNYTLHRISMPKANLTGKIMFNRYLVGSCIGFGSFGEVYLVYNTEAEDIYAMKVVHFI